MSVNNLIKLKPVRRKSHYYLDVIKQVSRFFREKKEAKHETLICGIINARDFCLSHFWSFAVCTKVICSVLTQSYTICGMISVYFGVTKRNDIDFTSNLFIASFLSYQIKLQMEFCVCFFFWIYFMIFRDFFFYIFCQVFSTNCNIDNQ